MANTLRDNLRDLMIGYSDLVLLRQHNITQQIVTDYTEMAVEEIQDELLDAFFEEQLK